MRRCCLLLDGFPLDGERKLRIEDILDDLLPVHGRAQVPIPDCRADQLGDRNPFALRDDLQALILVQFHYNLGAPDFHGLFFPDRNADCMHMRMSISPN